MRKCTRTRSRLTASACRQIQGAKRERAATQALCLRAETYAVLVHVTVRSSLSIARRETLMTLDRPLLMFGAHRRTVRSFDPVAIMPPVGVIATDSTGPCSQTHTRGQATVLPLYPQPAMPALQQRVCRGGACSLRQITGQWRHQPGDPRMTCFTVPDTPAATAAAM